MMDRLDIDYSGPCRPPASSASSSASCSACRRCGCRASISRSRPSRSRSRSRRCSNPRRSSTGPAACRASSSSSRTRRSACRSVSDQWLYYLHAGGRDRDVSSAPPTWCNSRTGRALIAIRDHPIAARAMGINVSLYKSLTFGVSALYTGVAGALGAIAIQFVAPDSFTFAARGRVVRRPGGRRRRLDPRHAVRRAVRAVRAEHRRVGSRRAWPAPSTASSCCWSSI